MSYINKALKKAQRQKDSQYQRYDGVLSRQGEKTNRFPGRALWWVGLSVIVGLLAFASYSWFDSKNQQPLEAKKKEPEKTVRTPVRQKPVAATVKKDARQKPVATPVKKNVTKKISAPDAKALYERARVFHKNGRLTNAKRLYQETLKVDPGYVDALNNLGVIFIHEKNYDAARQNFEKAIRVKPDHVDPYYNLACVYALMGETKPAIAHLKRAASLDRNVIKWAREDTDLKNLRGIPEFEEIIRIE
jgi:tetratricopeptide (TPR) repeat protein